MQLSLNVENSFYTSCSADLLTFAQFVFLSSLYFTFTIEESRILAWCFVQPNSLDIAF